MNILDETVDWQEADTDSPPVLRFFVPGIPRPGGSKKGFYNAKMRRVIITEDCKKNKDWRASVALCASEACKSPLQGPLKFTFRFLLPRPKGHFGKRGLLASAPKYPTTKPDGSKLARGTEDSLTGIVWRDDAQVVRQTVSKDYTLDTPGCWITVEEL